MRIKAFVVVVVGILLLSLGASAEAAVYTFRGPLYESATGPYTTSMRVTGYFETAGPLPASIPLTDISGQIVAYSFNDGVVTLDQTNSQICRFSVATNASGIPAFGYTTIDGVPSGVGSNAMDLQLGTNPNPGAQSPFITVGKFIFANAVCTTNAYDNANLASSTNGLVYVAPVASQPVPALGPWGLMLLVVGLVLGSGVCVRKPRRTRGSA